MEAIFAKANITDDGDNNCESIKNSVWVCKIEKLGWLELYDDVVHVGVGKTGKNK